MGSDDDCKIRLSHDSVQNRHAILTLNPDAWWLEDLAADGGTFVDSNRIDGRVSLEAGQEVRIGPFTLVLDPDKRTTPPTPDPAAPPAPAPRENPTEPPR